MRPRERAYALAAVVLVQLGIGAVLLRGFQVDVAKPAEIVQRLIDINLTKPPPRSRLLSRRLVRNTTKLPRRRRRRQNPGDRLAPSPPTPRRPSLRSFRWLPRFLFQAVAPV